MIRNNHGWGLKEMLFFSAIILFFVILAVVLINNMYEGLTSDAPSETTKVKEKSYQDIEQILRNAAKKYIIKTKDTSNLIISDELLSDQYITIEDLSIKGDTCSGYVIKDENYATYITCDNYETQGY